MKFIKYCALLFVFFNSYAQKTNIRTLFIGNSYTYTHNVPLITKNFAESVGDTLFFDGNLIGGSSLSNHASNPTSIGKIRLGNWNYVILQEGLNIGEASLPVAHYLDSIIRVHNCGETVFYMVWGLDTSKYNCELSPETCNEINQLHKDIRHYNMVLADSNKAIVSPVGIVWDYVAKHHPSISLYQSDGNHQTIAGSYMAACCFYTVFFRKDPTLSSYNFTLNDSDALNIRKAVKLIVYDSMLNWRIGKYSPNSYCRYLYSPSTYLFADSKNSTLTFKIISNTNWSVYSNKPWVSFDKSAGLKNDSVTITIEANTTKSSRKDTLILANNGLKFHSIILVQPSLPAFTTILSNSISGVTLYPNPVNDELILSLKEIKPNTFVSIYSLNGLQLFSQKVSSTKFEINMKPFAKGIYIIKIITDYGIFSDKIIKQ